MSYYNHLMHQFVKKLKTILFQNFISDFLKTPQIAEINKTHTQSNWLCYGIWSVQKTRTCNNELIYLRCLLSILTTKIKTRFFWVSITLPLKTIYNLINYWRISIKKMYFMCIIKPIYIYKNIKPLPIKKLLWNSLE